MARRRRRQVSPQETLITVCIAAAAGLLAIGWGDQPDAWGPLVASIVALAAVLSLAMLLFYAYRQSRKRRALWLLMNAEVDSMAGRQFEEYVAELFRRKGYRVNMTPVNDYGVDIVLIKDGVRTAVQTKRYGKPVAQAAIREAVAGMARYRCSRCLVVTNNVFTKAARELADSNRCTLIDRTGLAQLAESAAAVKN